MAHCLGLPFILFIDLFLYYRPRRFQNLARFLYFLALGGDSRRRGKGVCVDHQDVRCNWINQSSCCDLSIVFTFILSCSFRVSVFTSRSVSLFANTTAVPSVQMLTGFSFHTAISIAGSTKINRKKY